MHFADKIIEQVHVKRSPICLGLDPHYDLMPDFFKTKVSREKTIEKFLKSILDACHDLVACCKPNYAFFEEYGWQGIKVFENVCEYAHQLNLPVIVDAKRNDIGSTAMASARAFLQRDIFDALTVNPYLGEDGVRPFIDLAAQNNKGIFVLVKTSNPSGGEFQDLPVDDGFLYDQVAQSVARWGLDHIGKNQFSCIGAVVGATYPEELKILRHEMPAQILLLPGFGAQGATAEDLFPAFYEGGGGALVSSSRGILFASAHQDFELAARNAAIKAKEQFSSLFQ